ncbi:cation diffusion facilitator family transporter [Peribacillus faecalis]|nr:cation diffusion facilitator family transporter [Peribacillus faecalis]
MSHDKTLENLAQKGAWVSIFAYLFMSTIKLSFGYFGHSEALVADGLNNTTDIIASVAVLIGLKISVKPPDQDHLYGHTRAETVASLIAAFIMISVGLTVILQAIESLITPKVESPTTFTAIAAIFSALFMFGIYNYNRLLSKKTNNASLAAVAKDNLSDALVSIGAFIGIVGTWIGLPWLDPLAAFAVGFVICKTAWDIFKEASHSLTDGFDEELLEDISETISSTPGVLNIEDVKGRMHGNDVLVEATIQVEGSLNVIESHHISDEVEHNLHDQLGIRYVTIHVEPYLPHTKNGAKKD